MRSEYDNIMITGPVVIKQCEEMWGDDFWSVLVMGPTGSGKSSFIESLAEPSNPLVKISSNQLDGFTQTVSPYELSGITRNKGSGPMFLIDTPGFADAKITELDIVLMIQKYMKTERIKYFNRVLYMVPVTSIRMSGSQRQVLNTFKALTAVIKTADQITLVTTMWDNVHGERGMQRAEATYKQLQDDIWKECISQGSRLARFYNDRKSALKVLDGVLGDSKSYREFFPLELNARGNTEPLRNLPFGMNLYNDLTSRILSLGMMKDNLELQLGDASMEREDPLLGTMLQVQLREVEGDLNRLEQQLEEFGRPPTPPLDKTQTATATAVGSSSSPRGAKSAMGSVKRWGKKTFGLSR